MQNAQSVYLQIIEELLYADEIETALEELLKLEAQAQAGLRKDIIQQSGNFNSAKKQFNDDLIDAKEFRQVRAKTRNSLLELMKDIPRRLELNARIKNVDTYQFKVPDEVNLEKILGGQSGIVKINWLAKAQKAAKAVCRVVCADGNLGTGFLTKEGYVFTNNHVIASAEIARTARLEFNYEFDENDAVKSKIVYNLDATDFITSDSGKLDFARVKIIDRDDAPLRDWGYVDFDPESVPTIGEIVTLIQHPKGEDKGISVKGNEVLGQLNQYLFYSADSEPGSSGSPVFNKDWKVVAIHHAGKSASEGGMVINAQGDRKGANRGILFREIFGLLKTGKAGNAGGSSGAESFQSTGNETAAGAKAAPATTSTPATATAPATASVPPPAGAPKFVVVYDIADDAHSKALNRHLNVLKITKKIRIYNVNEALANEDPILRAEQELGDADYIVPLITVNLLNSNWFGIVYDALEKGRRLIPIRISNADTEGTGLEKLRGLPTLNRSVADFSNPDAAYTDIVGELKKLLPR